MNAADRYDSLFAWYGAQHGVDWRLLKAQARQESAFNPDAFNPRSGARGLSQFLRRTFEEWRDGTAGIETPPDVDLVLLDPRDPEDAIRAQAAMMAWALRVNGGDMKRALVAYNWGLGNLRRAIAAHGSDWFAHAPAESRAYVRRIATFYDEYRQQGG